MTQFFRNHLLRSLLSLNAIILASMSLFRIVFLLYFGTFTNTLSFPLSVVKALVLGVRFDAVIIAYINSIVVVGFALVWFTDNQNLQKKFLSALLYYYVTLYSLVFFILCIDFGFYSYFQNHINILIFGIVEDDTHALLTTIFQNYNVPLFLTGISAQCIALFFLCRYFIRTLKTQLIQRENRSLLSKIGLLFFFIGLDILLARGSVTMYPLGMMNTEISSNVFINKLPVNGVFALKEALTRTFQKF